jgi:hypothetical protein
MIRFKTIAIHYSFPVGQSADYANFHRFAAVLFLLVLRHPSSLPLPPLREMSSYVAQSWKSRFARWWSSRSAEQEGTEAAYMTVLGNCVPMECGTKGKERITNLALGRAGRRKPMVVAPNTIQPRDEQFGIRSKGPR